MNKYLKIGLFSLVILSGLIALIIGNIQIYKLYNEQINLREELIELSDKYIESLDEQINLREELIEYKNSYGDTFKYDNQVYDSSFDVGYYRVIVN